LCTILKLAKKHYVTYVKGAVKATSKGPAKGAFKVTANAPAKTTD
jgi:hypothetical protein